LDLVYRRRRGEQPALSEYLARFPESVDLVRAILSPDDSSSPEDSARTIGLSQYPCARDGNFSDAYGALWSRSGKKAPEGAWPEGAGYDTRGMRGLGGRGVVSRARQQHLNRLVALKMIRAGIDARPGDRERFLVEAEAVARLRHPNILQIYQIGEAGGLPYV